MVIINGLIDGVNKIGILLMVKKLLIKIYGNKYIY